MMFVAEFERRKASADRHSRTVAGTGLTGGGWAGDVSPAAVSLHTPTPPDIDDVDAMPAFSFDLHVSTSTESSSSSPSHYELRRCAGSPTATASCREYTK